MSPPLLIDASGPDHVGFLVIDSLVRQSSAGGVRIAPDISIDEIRALAREMSLKYAWCRLPRGGAKAGVRLPQTLSPEDRTRALGDFGKQIAPFLWTGLYYPGMDLGCSPDDLRAIYRGAGMELGPLTDTSYFTAITVAECIQAWADWSADRDPISLVVEGFGNVASHLAALLPDRRYRFVAIATIEGGVCQPAGWSSDELVTARRNHGDSMVRHLPGQKVPRGAIFLTEADVFLPSARVATITPEVASRVPARCLIPIANAPYVAGSIDLLETRRIAHLPGYVANCGGVFASSLFDSGVSKSHIVTQFAAHYRPTVRRLFEICSQRGVSPARVMDSLTTRSANARLQTTDRPSLSAKLLHRAKRHLPRTLRVVGVRRRTRETFRAMAADVDSLLVS